MTDSIDTAAARRAWEETTQGEWKSEEGEYTYPECDDRDEFARVLSADGVEIAHLSVTFKPKGLDTVQGANARFIARAHSEYPALLDEIERLRGEEKALIHDLENSMDTCTYYVNESERMRAAIEWIVDDPDLPKPFSTYLRTALGEKA